MKKILPITVLLILITKTASASTILINEILPNPQGPDSGKEWLEIINQGSQSINLENYQILLNNKTKYTFANKNFPATTIFTIDLSPLPNTPTQITFQNRENQILDQITYNKSPSGKSFSRIKNQFIWANPSKNQSNPQIAIHKGLLKNLIKKIKIPQNKNPKILKLIQKETLQILTLDRAMIKLQILRE